MTKKTNKNYYFIKKPTVFLLTMLSSSVAFSGNSNNYGFLNKNFINNIITNEVTGVVTDTNGQPLPGATVFIKGTNKGTQTDFDGRFILDVKEGDIIAISYVGYETQEILFNGQQTLNVSLQISTDALTEVVVVGYSSKSTRDITGSVEVVDVEELQKTAPLSIDQALQGQASGVTVGSEGGPGGGAAVRIRGFSSLNGTDPLYVVDGTPISGGINELNPSDIKSIQVLKDASSASIYGNRAASGVVIVTTKKGKRNQKAKLSLNSWAGIDFVPKGVFPDLATPQQIADAEFQRQRNQNISNPTHPQYGNGSTPVLPNFIIPERANTADLSLYSPSNPISRANKEGTDWFDEYFSPAVVHNTNISLSGGSKDATYYAGLGILDQDGVGLETYYRRYNARLNSEYSITDKFKIGQNLNFTYAQRVRFETDIDADDKGLNNAISNLYRIHPLIPVRDVFGGFSGTLASGLGNGKNPIATAIQNRDNRDNRFRNTGSFFAEYEIVKGLKAKTNLGIDVLSSEARIFRPSRLFDETIREGNTLTETFTSNTSLTWFNTLSYNETFAEKHDFGALIGSELVRNRAKGLQAIGVNLVSEDIVDSQFIDLASSSSASGGGFKDALFSVFGKIDYKFDDKYLFTATLRRDATSRFGSEDADLRVGYFPAFSAGWRVSGESFLENSDVVTNLLLKGGYGEIGNQSIPTGLDQNRSGTDDRFDFYPAGGSLRQGFALASKGNPNITWETKETINVGFDLTLLNKIDIGFEYFSTTTKDILSQFSLDATVVGQNNIIADNKGEISNNGFDLNLGFRDETSGGFSYKINANISAYKNEVEFIDPENPEISIFGLEYAFIGRINNTLKGEPIASFYGLQYEGIDSEGRAIFQNVNGDVDAEGNPIIDGFDRQVIGNPHPDFTYGFTFSADYKNFDFSLFLQGSQGNDVYNLTKVFTDTDLFAGAKSLDYVNAWTPTNTSARVPALGINSRFASEANSFFVEDGSFLRIKNIQLGYTLPRAFSETLKIDKLRVYVQAKNIHTFTKYSGLDPEVSVKNFDNTADFNNPISNNVRSLGVDSGVYPVSRSIIFGINLSL